MSRSKLNVHGYLHLPPRGEILRVGVASRRRAEGAPILNHDSSAEAQGRRRLVHTVVLFGMYGGAGKLREDIVGAVRRQAAASDGKADSNECLISTSHNAVPKRKAGNDTYIILRTGTHEGAGEARVDAIRAVKS